MNLFRYGCRAGIILLCIVLSRYANSQEESKILDTHIHLYDINRPGSFDFLDDHQSSGGDALRFPHLAQQFLDSASLAGVQYAYVVEASPRREDNFWLSEIADTSDCILGFSANLNPLDETFLADLDLLAKNPKFKGIRPRVTGIDLSDKTTQEMFGELSKRNLVLELWGSSSNIATIAALYPNMNIIVNHFAGGAVRGSGVVNESSYKQKLAVLAAHKNVYLKISALYTLSGQNPAPLNMEYYKPLIDVAVDVFGPERVMYGSNWSLSGLRGPYKNMITILQEYCNVRNNLSAEQLFFTNAVKAYGLFSFN